MKNEQPVAAKSSPTRERFTRGGRNLILLGIISTVVACLTSGISLAIYHNSGDIYLDRSRPGFIPEEGNDDDKDPVPEVYVFEKSGKLTMTDIEEYLKNLDLEVKAIDSIANPFGPDILSDDSLGINK